MDLLSALEVLARRWIVVLAGLALTAVATLAVAKAVAPEYETYGEHVLLVPANRDATGENASSANPYLGFGRSLDVTAALLARSMSDQAVARELRERELEVDYAVAVAPRGAPLLSISARAHNSYASMAGYLALVDILKQRLADQQLQLGAPPDLMITSAPVLVPRDPVARQGSRVRAAAGVLALGGAATFLAPFLINAVALRRRRGERDGDDDRGATPGSSGEPAAWLTAGS